MDRAVNWLVEKIHKSDLDPIDIKSSQVEEQKDIHYALKDPRSCRTPNQIQKEDCYLTPDFLETFNLFDLWGRDYLKIRIKFASVKLGFTAQTVAPLIKFNTQTIPVKCCVGQTQWLQRWEKKQPADIPKFDKCPFTMWFER